MLRIRMPLYFSTLLATAVSLFVTNGLPAQWIDGLPQEIRDSILWSADVEEGNLYDWEFNDYEFPGGGIFNTGGHDVEAGVAFRFAHSGWFSARAKITNAYRAQNGSRAIRLMRWTDRPWDDGGEFFPKNAYYSTWMYFPKTYNPDKHPKWDPGDGGWWNVFQFKANDSDGDSQPIWTLNVDHIAESKTMEFYLYSKENKPSSYAQPNPIAIPVGKWVHVEAFYQVSAQDDGQITIWQNGKKILDIQDVRTALSENNENAIWGIGNYTDHIAGETNEGTATIFFDDAIVSTVRVSTHLE